MWTVDAKKLRGTDKVAVSPPFKVDGAEGNSFKMMLYPMMVNEKKGGASFKKAKGKGFVQLKCETVDEDTLGTVKLSASVGSGREDSAWQNPLDDEVRHNFGECGVCSLQPKNEDDHWNFLNAVDEPSQTFAVRLQLQPVQAMS